MSELLQQDAAYIWHPYTQMGLNRPVLPIVRGEGAYLYDEGGNSYLDVISSWWTNLHGHAHPHIATRVSEQLRTLEHVIFAGVTHPPAATLCARLQPHLPAGQERFFFSDNGSTAVEVALKMALQYWFNQGEKKTHILAFEGAYHGDTFGAMSVSGRSIFTRPFEDLLFEVHFLPVPVPGKEEQTLQALDTFLEAYGKQTAALIFEPLVQGTAGMVMYEPSVLDEIMRRCRRYQVITIADEVMTGFGRTGKFFAVDYLQEKPDIMCFSKGLTGGAMAMGLSTCTAAIYEAFRSADKLKTLFHGHSYTGNPLSCAAALASLDLMEQPETMANISRISAQHQAQAQKMKSMPGVKDCRVRGTIFAIELETGQESSYLNQIRDQLYDFFLQNGVLLRPLGNIMYLLPPYCITTQELERVYELLERAVQQFTQQ